MCTCKMPSIFLLAIESGIAAFNNSMSIQVKLNYRSSFDLTVYTRLALECGLAGGS